MKDVKIRYRARKENSNTDVLSWSLHLPPPEVGTVDGGVQVSAITSQGAKCRDQTNEGQELLTVKPDKSLEPFRKSRCPLPLAVQYGHGS